MYNSPSVNVTDGCNINMIQLYLNQSFIQYIYHNNTIGNFSRAIKLLTFYANVYIKNEEI